MKTPLDSERERALIQQTLTEPDAFRELYRHYFPRVYAYVAYRVGHKHDTEDLVSEVFMQVVKSLRQFEYRGAGSFSAWLFRIAHNALYQFYTSQRGKDAPLSFDDLPDIRSDLPTPDSDFARQEQFAYLRALIASLTPRRQEMVVLRYFAGLSNREIAAVLDLDERTVASHLSRALEDLQRKYHEEAQ